MPETRLSSKGTSLTERAQRVKKTNGHAKNGHANGHTNGHANGQVVQRVWEWPTSVVKRDGRVVEFDVKKIEYALERCFGGWEQTPSMPISDIAHKVAEVVASKYKTPTVENVQDVVEMTLSVIGEFEAAKHYILYRAEHAKMREDRPVPDEVRDAFALADQYFPTQLQKFQFYDKYSRFDYDIGRRETWLETVNRSVDFLKELSQNKLEPAEYDRLRKAILDMKAMPSMRMLAMAGPAARRQNIAIYNCSYMPVDSIDAWVEGLIISMSGCGVGFSVEGKYVEQLPRVKRQTNSLPMTFTIEDSTEGWAAALRLGLATWFEGGDIKFDFSQIRPMGAVLKTKGGRASGPEPLRKMLEFTQARILARQGTFLRPIDAHDMMCEVGNAAVSGGVRRTAMISLFDWDDVEMRNCKSGDFERDNSQRWNANNSAVWPDRGVTQMEVLQQMMDMVQGGRGEPGIFNRQGSINMRPARREEAMFGTNPCITGDTWVAVADGRGRIKMKDLVEEGRDVDVYTAKDKTIVIRKMRNPRKTGEKVQVYKVWFSDGSYIRVTPNHKFILMDGSEKQAVDLIKNDALVSMTAFGYLKKGLPKVEKVNYDSAGGYRMLQFGQFRKSEHRIIYQHNTGVNVIGIDEQVHHRDFDGLNNHISNLELLTAKDHAQIHRERMMGKNNPVHQITDQWRANISEAVSGLANGNAKEITNEELEEKIRVFVRDLGQTPTSKQYCGYAKRNNLPQFFSEYRRQYFGSGVSRVLSEISAKEGVIPHYEARARRVTELPVRFHDGHTYIIRNCEVCGEDFEVALSRREQATCSYSCGMKLYYQLHGSDIRSESIRQARTKNHGQLRDQQMRIYNDLLVEIGRHPNKKEWQARCDQMGISFEISRKSSPFRYWQDLETGAMMMNHRVMGVEPDGEEDVFTGTVDETHTFFAIGTERKDGRGRVEMAYVLNRQCGEILLRPYEFCNLTIAVARADDTYETLKDKVEVAAILGTIQSMATHFPGLRPMWKENCEKERLLGVDITGQMDSKVAQDPAVMSRLRQVAVETNRTYAAKLGIGQSVAVTCVKPSGNSSQLLNCSSGLHARWAPYYIRNVRVAAHSPVYKVLRDCGVAMDPENGQMAATANTWVVHFPVQAPDGAVTRKNRSAMEQCEYWLRNKTYWTEHNPSVTISYYPHEVLDVVKWVWEHKDLIGGMAFLPAFDANYAQMPYQEITKEEYEMLAAKFPVIDFSKIYRYEEDDLTTAAQELACIAGACEIEVVPTGEGHTIEAKGVN